MLPMAQTPITSKSVPLFVSDLSAIFHFVAEIIVGNVSLSVFRREYKVNE